MVGVVTPRDRDPRGRGGLVLARCGPSGSVKDVFSEVDSRLRAGAKLLDARASMGGVSADSASVAEERQ